MRRATKSSHVRPQRLKNRGATLDKAHRIAEVRRRDDVPLKALHGNLEDELEMLTRDPGGRLYPRDEEC